MSTLKQVDVSNLAITGLDITLINIKREVREHYHLREKSQWGVHETDTHNTASFLSASQMLSK